MYRITEHRVFTIAAIVIAAIFWNFDAALHFILYGEPRFELIPDDLNELWKRLVIAVLIVLFGLYADRSARKQLLQEKQRVALDTYNSMIHATQHILNNLLNQMQLFRVEALRSRDFDPDVIRLYDQSMDEAKVLVEKLSAIEEISESNIRASIDPAKQKLPPGLTGANGT
jgi:hypothetical protein